MESSSRKRSHKIVYILCATIVFVSATFAWVYVRNQEIQQKDRALIQRSQDLKYEQEQLNKRQQFKETCEHGDAYNKFGAGC